ncbi:hypothetical protein ASPWEDRAFT_133474 [Aspergillus wentii DTO 134E9]|uniref:Uncharacterized protein n=1 Tax=Aspergillus wentii DTO 134E9 TaxID=1073089 RepID=A0A1L9RKS0_ASPWE|nr:uncharacterized protein ASPWEDRAFT_133474 [Aspergillus wentii DTO 134E9]OJJ35437.1 hypothetical protein ASPWEDRAFT_133474 [Aspergillus wentii DTO 134E9]
MDSDSSEKVSVSYISLPAVLLQLCLSLPLLPSTLLALSILILRIFPHFLSLMSPLLWTPFAFCFYTFYMLLSFLFCPCLFSVTPIGNPIH